MLDDKKILFDYGYFYIGYKSEYYFWDMFKLLFKLLLIILFTLFTAFEIIVKKKILKK
jgi:hypothetical protein